MSINPAQSTYYISITCQKPRARLHLPRFTALYHNHSTILDCYILFTLIPYSGPPKYQTRRSNVRLRKHGTAKLPNVNGLYHQETKSQPQAQRQYSEDQCTSSRNIDSKKNNKPYQIEVRQRAPPLPNKGASF